MSEQMNNSQQTGYTSLDVGEADVNRFIFQEIQINGLFVEIIHIICMSM